MIAFRLKFEQVLTQLTSDLAVYNVELILTINAVLRDTFNVVVHLQSSIKFKLGDLHMGNS